MIGVESALSRGGVVVHPKSLFPTRVLPKLLTTLGGELGLAEIVSNFKRFGLDLGAVRARTLESCDHGVCVVRISDEDSVTPGQEFDRVIRRFLDSDPEAMCCRVCIPGSLGAVRIAEDLWEGEDGVGEEAEDFFSGGADCFLRAFPGRNQVEAWAKCGAAPRASVVVAAMDALTVGAEVVERPVVITRKGSFVHLNFGGPEGQTYAELRAQLQSYPRSVCVAGACGNLGFGFLAVPVCASCRARHSALKRILEEVVAECQCKEKRVVSGVWKKTVDGPEAPGVDYQVLSTVSRRDTLLLMSREPMERVGACPPFRLGPEEVAQVRLHEGEKGPCFCVEGSFVQVWLPPGTVIVLPEGITIVAGGEPVVLSAVGRVSAYVLGPETQVLARGRSYSSRTRWMHAVLAEDAAETFSRFWSKAGPSLGLFSFGVGSKGKFVKPKGAIERSDGVSEVEMVGSARVRGGSEGTAVEVRSGTLQVGRVILGRGHSMVFGREVSWHGMVCKATVDTGWNLMFGDNTYYLDDGGPSGSEGLFFDEY